VMNCPDLKEAQAMFRKRPGQNQQSQQQQQQR